MALQFVQFPYGSDNYGVLVHDEETGRTACVDAGSAEEALKALQKRQWQLHEIWITHHHWDHTEGLLSLKEATSAHVRGPSYISQKPIEGLDETLSEGDQFTFAGEAVEILHTPGHTLDMINFYLPQSQVLFSGDTLFMLGCGRVFEGSLIQMHESMQKLAALPNETLIYCSHEYTLANAKFALSVDPENKALQARAKIIEAMREADQPTVPARLQDEKATNPFIRTHDSAIRAHFGLENADDASVFAALRGAKDKF